MNAIQYRFSALRRLSQNVGMSESRLDDLGPDELFLLFETTTGEDTLPLVAEALGDLEVTCKYYSAVRFALNIEQNIRGDLTERRDLYRRGRGISYRAVQEQEINGMLSLSLHVEAALRRKSDEHRNRSIDRMYLYDHMK